MKEGNVVENVKSKVYCLTLHDLNGSEWNLNVVGIDQITTDYSQININEIKNI